MSLHVFSRTPVMTKHISFNWIGIIKDNGHDDLTRRSNRRINLPEKVFRSMFAVKGHFFIPNKFLSWKIIQQKEKLFTQEVQ